MTAEIELQKYIWQEAGYDSQNIWHIGKWIKDDSEEEAWNASMKEAARAFRTEFMLTKEYKELFYNWKAELEELKNSFKDGLTWAYSKVFRLEEYKSANEEKKNLYQWFIKDSIYIVYFQDLMENLERAIKKNSFYFGGFKKKSNKITPEMIARAKEFPIKNLIESKNYWALCPFHNDTHASLYLKQNFYHCFSCGETGDVISFVMKIQNLSFSQAINKLL